LPVLGLVLPSFGWFGSRFFQLGSCCGWFNVPLHLIRSLRYAALRWITGLGAVVIADSVLLLLDGLVVADYGCCRL